MTLCVTCGTSVECDPALSKHGILCDACFAAAEKERLKRGDVWGAESRRALWLRKCPALYRDTVIEKLPYRDISERILGYSLPESIGLNLWGHPNTGKTRTLLMVLECYYVVRRKSLQFFTALEFMNAIAERDFKRSGWVSRLIEVDLLAFDDMDKMSLTKDQELVFFGIIDSRISARRPLFLTHNSDAGQLTYHFSKTGQALVRRIRQATKSFHFPKREQQQTLL